MQTIPMISTIAKGTTMNWSLGLGAMLVGAALSASSALAADTRYEQRFPDFACDVDKGPIGDAQSITVESLKQMSQEENGQEKIDRIYAQLTSGPMPSGFYNGNIIFAKSDMSKMTQQFVSALGIGAVDSNAIKTFGETLWHGKVFKADPFAKEGVPTAILGNKMPVTASQPLAKTFETVLKAMKYPSDKIPSVLTQLKNANTNQWRFPAKVFCGQSLLDSRRESLIIDYAHSETVTDSDQNEDSKIKYAKAIDEIADRKHLQIRDEIRMVRPGFYLGRAYMGRVFVLNFTLECREGECQSAPQTGDACDVGSQRLANSNTQCMPMAQFRQ